MGGGLGYDLTNLARKRPAVEAPAEAPAPKKKGFWKKVWDKGGKKVALVAGAAAATYALGKGAQYLDRRSGGKYSTAIGKAANAGREAIGRARTHFSMQPVPSLPPTADIDMEDMATAEGTMERPTLPDRLRAQTRHRPPDLGPPGETLFDAPEDDPPEPLPIFNEARRLVPHSVWQRMPEAFVGSGDYALAAESGMTREDMRFYRASQGQVPLPLHADHGLFGEHARNVGPAGHTNPDHARGLELLPATGARVRRIAARTNGTQVDEAEMMSTAPREPPMGRLGRHPVTHRLGRRPITNPDADGWRAMRHPEHRRDQVTRATTTPLHPLTRR